LFHPWLKILKSSTTDFTTITDEEGALGEDVVSLLFSCWYPFHPFHPWLKILENSTTDFTTRTDGRQAAGLEEISRCI